MKSLVLYVFAWAIAWIVGVLGGVLFSVAAAITVALFTGEAPDYSSYLAGFVAASITWPLGDWLEARFGVAGPAR